MQIFKKVDDIDLSRFAKDVDYKYNGEFSPCKLMERIVDNDKIANKKMRTYGNTENCNQRAVW